MEKTNLKGVWQADRARFWGRYKFLVYPAAAVVVANLLLIFLVQSEAGIYYIVNSAIFLITTLYIDLKPRSLGAINIITSVILFLFLVIITLKTIALLG